MICCGQKKINGVLSNLPYASWDPSTNYRTSDWTSALDRDTSYAECINATDWTLKGDFYSDSSNFIEFTIGPCNTGCGWTDPLLRADDIDGKFLDLYFLSEYYDFTAPPTDPIRDTQRLIQVATNFGNYEHWDIRIKENIVKYINGTSESFYSLSSVNKYIEKNFDFAFKATFRLDSQYEVYEQYMLREINTTIRNLQTVTTTTNNSTTKDTDKEKTRKTLYYILFIWAQLGGIYGMLSLIASILLRSYKQKSYLFKAVNKFNMLASSKDSIYDPYVNESFEFEGDMSNSSKFTIIQLQITIIF